MNKMAPEYEFPKLYYENYLVLLVRDPHCIYAYWELTPDLRGMVNHRFGRDGNPAQFRLRVNETTGLEHNTNTPHNLFDISLHPMADNYFIKDVGANRSYYVEIGVVTGNGGFLALLKSNSVHTPRNRMANNQELTSKETAPVKEKSGSDLLIGSFARQGTYGESSEHD